ncbi:TPA: hypothetical protein ACP32N_003279 [Pseudomonas aeruginosa]
MNDSEVGRMLTRSSELEAAIQSIVGHKPPQPGKRFMAAMIACDLAMEHARALRVLYEAECPTTAVSVMRMQFESLTRAYWLRWAAPDLAVTKLLNALSKESEQQAKNLPSVSAMIEAVKKDAPPEASAMLVQFKDVTWGAMNSYVHSGIHPLRRHVEGHPIDLVLQIIQMSNGLLTMTGMLAAILTDDQQCIEPMRKIQTQFKDCLPVLIKR